MMDTELGKGQIGVAVIDVEAAKDILGKYSVTN